ncbi:MAG: Xaa-Pro peptidase family protein [Candidatus Micrarchaeota archaeon]|nr:Xaa-Pro peptidase family protein [Candidatus Micrarchaeota archaeon]
MDLDILLYRGEQFNSNFYYFSNCDIDHSFFLLKDEKRYLFVPRMNERRAEEEFDGEIIVYKDIKEIKKYAGDKINCDFSSLSANLYLKLNKLFTIKDISEQLLQTRMVKSSEEVELIKKATEISKNIFANIDFSEMKTEMDVKHYLLASTLEQNVEPAFNPIVATDKNSALPHYEPGDVKLGSMVLVDYAVKYKNYCSDLTRCFFLKRDKRKEEAYESARLIFYDLIDAIPNLKTGKQLALLSEKLFKKAKLPSLIHSIGHGVGLDVHEFPRLSKKFNDNLSGAILAIEPAVYFKDFGVRYEETLYFDGKTVKVL